MPARIAVRLQRLERHAQGVQPSGPSAVAMLENGDRIGRVQGQWIPWPSDRTLPTVCKAYGFDPRIVFDPASQEHGNPTHGAAW